MSYRESELRGAAEDAADIIEHMIHRRALGYKDLRELKEQLAKTFVKLGMDAAGTVCTGGPW